MFLISIYDENGELVEEFEFYGTFSEAETEAQYHIKFGWTYEIR